MASFLHYCPLKTRAGRKALDSSCQCLRLSRCLSPASRRTAKLQRAIGKPPKWHFEVWLTQREEILIASACLIPLQKRVSWNKDMSINTQDSAEVVCTEQFRAVFHSSIPKHHTDTARAPAPARSVHHTDVITHNVCYHSYSKGFITTVISTFDVCLQCAPRMWHHWFKPYDWTLYFSHMRWTT